MLKTTPIKFGSVNGTIYDFENEGDILPMHWHAPDNSHMTVVARGSFIARGKDWEKTLSAGNVIDWQAYVQHEFVASEANSRIVNISTGPKASLNIYE